VNPISEDMLEVYVQRFHVLGLKKYVLDTNNAIVTEPMEVAKNLVYKEWSMQIPNYRVKQL